MMEVNNVDEEDEDVVIQGSALHEHLSRLGYTDFESVTMSKKIYVEEKPFSIDIRNTTKRVYEKLFSFYSWITQEKRLSRQQLNIILNAEALLSDHSATINSILTLDNNDIKKISLQDLIVTGIILISSTYIPICNNKIWLTLLASSAICSVSYMKHLRFRAYRDLKNVILLQNEIFAMCKKVLKILRHDYKIKMGLKTRFQQFFHFLGERLCYLQTLTETIVKFMENICYIYYQCSLSIAKLLPSDILNENLFTKFESISVGVSGEINYQALQKLYHTYLLIQSEMLCLLATAYNNDTWIGHCKKIPETKLAYIVHILAKRLMIYKLKLSELINAYHSCKAEPNRCKIRGVAKWNNPSIQLDLASHKLQLAYNQVFSIFQDMDNFITHETAVTNETAEILMKKLDEAFKEIGTAKIIAEFIILLMKKSGIDKQKNDQIISDGVMIDQNPNLSVIIDSDPEIFDEVFEEYITEENLKSLCDEADEYSLGQYKIDKLLAKSFMVELKEALVDKHKSMSERESKALQRICTKGPKNCILFSQDNINKEDYCFIPVPPPMPSYYIWSISTNNIKSSLNYKRMGSRNCEAQNSNLSIQEEIDESNEKANTIQASKHGKVFNIPCSENDRNINAEQFISVPQILLETQATQYIMKSHVFLQEEVFIGSGENSEDEIIEHTNDEDEDNENKHSQ